MKTLLRAACLAALISLVAAPLSIGDPSRRSDEEVLRELKEVLWPRAYFEQDDALLDSILADDFQMVDAEGKWSTKADQLERVRSSKPSYDSLVFQIKRLDIFANGSAIVAGTGIVKGTDQDGAYTFHYQSTNVLIKRAGVWRAVASHVSGVERIEPE